jgi:hypothetical protein
MLLKSTSLFISLLFVICFVGTDHSSAQSGEPRDLNWLRVRTDDGEFSVEVPPNYKYFFNKDGFSLSASSVDYRLTNVRLLNSFFEGTAVGFEIYDGGKGALDGIFESDQKRDLARASEEKRAGFKVRQIVSKSPNSYAVRQYFYSKSKIYVLTTASRTGETQAMKRFLDSVIFVPNRKDPAAGEGTALSKLKMTDVEVEMKVEDPHSNKSQSATAPAPTPDPNTKSVVLVSKPKGSYVDSARQKNVTGSVRLRLTLADDGSIPRITVVRTLPEGLLRQVLFAALRIKFLPKEVDGRPVSLVATFDYGFDIY